MNILLKLSGVLIPCTVPEDDTEGIDLFRGVFFGMRDVFNFAVSCSDQ